MKNNSLNIHAAPQFNIKYGGGWFSGNEEKLISNYELFKKVFCTTSKADAKTFLHGLQVLKSSEIIYYNLLWMYCICTLKFTVVVINKTFVSINDQPTVNITKPTNCKYYKATKYSTKKKVSGDDNTSPRTQKINKDCPQYSRNTIWWHTTEDPNEEQKAKTSIITCKTQKYQTGTTKIVRK